MSDNNTYDVEPISDELDYLVCALIDYGLDLLGETAILEPTLAVEDASHTHVLLTFSDGDIEEALERARTTITSHEPIEGLTGPVLRYALAYDGAIEEEPHSGYEAALIVEYGEQGMSRGYSAYLLYRNEGDSEAFMWTDPEAAGVCKLLV